MKLLLDENLSRRIVPMLQARWPGSSQVALLGLERASDAELCAYAAAVHSPPGAMNCEWLDSSTAKLRWHVHSKGG